MRPTPSTQPLHRTTVVPAVVRVRRGELRFMNKSHAAARALHHATARDCLPASVYARARLHNRRGTCGACKCLPAGVITRCVGMLFRVNAGKQSTTTCKTRLLAAVPSQRDRDRYQREQRYME